MAENDLKRGYPPKAKYDYAWPVDYPYDADPLYPTPDGELFSDEEEDDGPDLDRLKGYKFDPRQPRDREGRWTDTPGGPESMLLAADDFAASEAPEPEVSPEALEAAATWRPIAGDDEGALAPREMDVYIHGLNALAKVLKVPDDQPPVVVQSADQEQAHEMNKGGAAAQVMLSGITREPKAIVLNPRVVGHGSGATESDVLHEIGHTIDYGSLRKRHALPIDIKENKPYSEQEGVDKAGVMRAINDSPEVERMREYRPGDDLAPLPDSAWAEISEQARQRNANYASSGREAFARAFAQWIALRAKDEHALATMRNRERWPIDGYHWSPENFAPIAEAFDKLFAEEGMLR